MKEVMKVPTDAVTISWRPGGIFQLMLEILSKKYYQVKAKEYLCCGD